MEAIALMHAQTEKLKPALSSHCLQSVKTNRLPEDPISASISWVGLKMSSAAGGGGFRFPRTAVKF